MKVVLFCGGMGMRIRDYSESVPKPMVPIGYRPILWHVMKYYAHYGFKDFVLALGYKADIVKNYFLHYDEAISNDFVLNGGGDVQLLKTDMHDWRITFVDTGLAANIGERLLAVREHLRGEDVFLANYSDGVTDLDLKQYVNDALERNRVANFLMVRPNQTFHVVGTDDEGLVRTISHVSETDVWINGGFFVLKQEIFDYMERGDELVVEPFHRLIPEQQLRAHRYDGFFAAMDTFKDREVLEEMWRSGQAPWMVW
jgi:glucose-1-phosphate cytidylyltransferase